MIFNSGQSCPITAIMLDHSEMKSSCIMNEFNSALEQKGDVQMRDEVELVMHVLLTLGEVYFELCKSGPAGWALTGCIGEARQRMRESGKKILTFDIKEGRSHLKHFQ